MLLATSPVLPAAAQFETGQAARAVLGQASFSAHETGLDVTSLVVAGDRLYAADRSNQILTFNLSRLADMRAAPQGGSLCAVCVPTPDASVNESVMPGVATASVWNKTVAFVDLANHRVLLWRDSSAHLPGTGPDVILGRSAQAGITGASTLLNPVSVALDGSRLFVGDAGLHRVLVWNRLPVSDDQPADAVLGQPDFTASNAATDGPAPDSILTPIAMAASGGNLFVADSAAHRILMFSAVDLPLAADSVVNSASRLPGPLAPGTLITIRSSGIGQPGEALTPEPADAPFPDSLGGVQAILDGEPLPLLSLQDGELQAQLPYELGARTGASLYLRIVSQGRTRVTAPVALKLVPASPGLFALAGDEPRSGILLRAATPITEENPARPGDTLTVWATGLGAVADTAGVAQAGHPLEGPALAVNTLVAAQVDGQSTTVLSAKLLPGATGVYEIQVLVPEVSAGASQMRMSVLQNGIASNVVTFPVRPVAIADEQ